MPSETPFLDRVERVLSEYIRLTGVPATFVSIDQISPDAKPFAANCKFCRLMQSSESGSRKCLEQQLSAFQSASLDHSYQAFICHAGIWEWIVPVYSDNTLAGYIISGGVTCSECAASNIIDQHRLYTSQFHIDLDDFKGAISELITVPRDSIDPSAQLLLTLLQLYGLFEKTAPRFPEPIQRSDDIVGFLMDDVSEKELDVSRPLSFYINENNLDLDALSVFWKTLEVVSADIFKSILSALFLEGSIAFDNIMHLAYNEKTLREAKTSAMMLYHIFSLKYYSKDFYDLRFYKLTYETISKISAVTSIQDIRLILNNSYKHMYQMYNDNSPKKNLSISQKIVKYLESNYDKDVTISSIAGHLYLSPAYVSKLYRAETGITIKKTLTSIRMRHAQDLLLNTNMSIKDIGFAVGYKNELRGFYKRFNSYFGMTCSEMRKRYGLSSGNRSLPSV